MPPSRQLPSAPLPAPRARRTRPPRSTRPAALHDTSATRTRTVTAWPVSSQQNSRTTTAHGHHRLRYNFGDNISKPTHTKWAIRSTQKVYYSTLCGAIHMHLIIQSVYRRPKMRTIPKWPTGLRVTQKRCCPSSNTLALSTKRGATPVAGRVDKLINPLFQFQTVPVGRHLIKALVVHYLILIRIHALAVGTRDAHQLATSRPSIDAEGRETHVNRSQTRRGEARRSM